MFFTVIYTFLICIIATTIGAISGVGGGVIIKPVMDAVSGLAVSQISFLSGCTVLAMCVVSLLRSRGSGVRIQPKTGTRMALGGAVGGLLGKGWFEWFRSFFGNEPLIGVVQSVLMILLTGGVLLYVLHKEKIRTLHLSHAAVCLLVGLLGSRISRRLDNAAVDRVFRVLLIVITLISCYNLWHYAALAF